MAFILLGASAVGVVLVGYASHVPNLIRNAIRFRHKDKKVNNINDLQEGDHIIFKKSGPGPSHHAIVVDVDRDKNEYKIIHIRGSNEFTGQSCKSAKAKSSAAIYEDTNTFIPGKMFLREYKGERSDRKTTVARAYQILEKSDKVEYNTVTNNCEHVASWCVFGFSRSKQVDDVMALLGPIGVIGKIAENISRLRRDGNPAN